MNNPKLTAMHVYLAASMLVGDVAAQPIPRAVAAANPAADYPAKSIRFIVPFPPGGGTDLVARLLAQKLTERFGQQVVVDNRGGANAIIGTDLAAKAAPDGYTLVLALPAWQLIRAFTAICRTIRCAISRP